MAIKVDLNDWHPDIYDFIHVKDDTTKLQRMNISVSLSDRFMRAVRNDSMWDLKFPDYTWDKEVYNAEWDGDIDNWEAKGYPIVVYKTVPAKDLYREIMESAWRTGEPGVSFRDTMNRYNPNPHLGKVSATNPCSEFCSIPYNSCNLGSINLVTCVENDKNNWDKLDSIVVHAVRFLDNMITVNKLPLEKIEYITKGTRSIGLGLMGFADMLYLLGIQYNSAEGYAFADGLMKRISETAINYSLYLGDTKGQYDFWKGSSWHYDGNKIRNSNLLSIAPTGSISFIAGVSGGIEPNFGLVYTRRTNEGDVYYIVNPIFEKVLLNRNLYSGQLLQKIVDNHGSCQGIAEIPKDIQKVFVTAHDITPNQHTEMVAIFQKYVDLSISKTVNLPNSATVEDVMHVYQYAHDLGCKGITVYRDGSRDNQTLSTTTTKTEEVETETCPCLGRGEIVKAPNKAFGITYKFVSGCGNVYLNVTQDTEGNINQTFTNKGSSGTCRSNQEAVSRLISLALRGGIALDDIIDQLESVDICPSFVSARKSGKKVSKGASCPHAIANILKEAREDLKPDFSIDLDTWINEKSSHATVNVCPDCGEVLEQAEGCVRCIKCGFTKC